MVMCVVKLMNKQWVMFHLNEALEEIEMTIQDIKTDPEYDNGEYSVAITHMYHHLNTAWNSRDISDKQTEDIRENNFYKWRQFPDDLDM